MCQPGAVVRQPKLSLKLSATHRMKSIISTLLVLALVVFALVLFVLGGTTTLAEQRSATQDANQDETPPAQEPQVAAASDEGERAMRRFQVADGLSVSLFAAEPLVANPVAFCFDNNGRMFVAETFRQERGVEDNRNHMNWLDDEIAATTVEERVAVFRKYLGERVMNYTQHDDRIRLVWDSDGDGQADQASVFANGFNNIADGTGAGVLAHDGNLYYTCIPKLWMLRDDDGDNAADVRNELQDGYGVHVAFRGHDMHGLTLGPDGRLYFSIGDRGFNVQTPEGQVAQPHTGAVLRCDLDGSGLEIYSYGLRNPQELAFDDYGNLFTGDNNSDSGDRARWVYLMEGGDSGWRMSFQYFNDRGPWNREQLWHPQFPEQASNIVPPIMNFADGPSGLAYYPGTGLGDEYLDTFFLCDFRGASGSSGVRTIQVQPQGAGFSVSQDDRLIWQILATDIEFGPHGAAYVSDWVDGWTGIGKGRVYKVANEELAASELVAEVDRLLAANFDGTAIADLQPLLGHADRRVRMKAQYEIASREPAEASHAFAAAAHGGGHDDDRLALLARLHGVWGLGQLARRDAAEAVRAQIGEQLAGLLADEEIEVRANAARALADSGAALQSMNKSIAGALIERLKDPSLRVQSLAAIALGKYGDNAAVAPLLELLNRNADVDPFLRHAAVMGLVEIGDVDHYAAMAEESPSSLSVSQRRGLLLALRRLQDPRVAIFLRDADPSLITDAARAINDEPIDAATAELAKLIEQPGLPAPALRRALNANLRLRTLEHASAVARFAGNAQAKPEMRREAIAILREWPNELARDRVMGLWHQQLFETSPSRDKVADVVTPQLANMLAGNEEVREQTARLISSLRIGEAGNLLHDLFTDTSQPAATRATALDALFNLEDSRAGEALLAALEDDSAIVRISGLRQATNNNPNAALEHLPDALASESLAEQQAAIAALGQLDSRDADALLTAGVRRLADGNMPAELQLDTLLAAEQKRNIDEIAQTLEVIENSRDANDPLSPYTATLAGGDARRGEELFFNRLEISCQRCHTVDQRGGAIGPELSKIAEKRDRRYLLEALVTPNKQIAEGFETLLIETVDGRVLSGILKEETDDFVRLQTPEGNILHVAKSEIDIRDQGQSAMPNDLVQKISLRELRDLVEYLAERK